MTEGFSNEEIIDALAQMGLPTSERSIRRALSRWGASRPAAGMPQKEGIMWTGEDDVQITSGVKTAELNTADKLMEQRGLDPSEWEVHSQSMSEWDGPEGLRKNSMKVHLKRKVPVELLIPARVDGPKFKPPKRRKSTKAKVRKIVFVGDQQAPFHDVGLHTAFLEFLWDWQPDEGVLIGDTGDFPDISRHPDNPEHDVTAQESVDESYLIMRDYREAWEDALWKKLAGNHDERIRRYQINNAPKTYGMRRALVPGETPEPPVMDLEHLMRLDELGIEYIRPQGDYEHEQIKVSPYLAALHGWIAKKGSGTSALATLEHLGYSVIHGHTHRQGIVFKTIHDIDDNPITLTACETGCMCDIGGLGYAKAPNWQNGFATAEVYEDGKFHLDLATYIDGTLYYRDLRY